MTPAEVRIQINKLVNNLPEKHLQEVLDLLNKLTERAEREKFVEEILKEDYEVFRKLAE